MSSPYSLRSHSSQHILKTASTWISTCVCTSDHERSHLFKGSGVVLNGLTGIKMRWWNACLFLIGAEYTRAFEVSPQIKIWGTEVEPLKLHMFADIYIYIYMLIWTHYLFWCGELTPDFFFSPQCHDMSIVDFVVLPPGRGRSVTDFFWGWDAHEAQLRCPDGVWVVIEEDVVPDHGHRGNLPLQGKFPR